MSRRSTTLYVSGFSSRTRAKDLAYEFERFGRLVRCDIPAPKTANSRVFAFVEFEDPRDADDAFRDMHNRPIGGDDYIMNIQWAKQPPSSLWRFDGPPGRRDERPRDDRPRDERPRDDDYRRRSPPRDAPRDSREYPAAAPRARSRSPGRRRDDYPAPAPAAAPRYDDAPRAPRDYDDRRERDYPPAQPVDDRRDGRREYA